MDRPIPTAETSTEHATSDSDWVLPSPGGHMERRSGIYLQTMTMKDVDERLEENDVLIVPLGATEAHGPNAPLGEDIFLVTRMAELVAARTGCTLSAPLWWGSHPYHHLGMPGTIPIPDEVFTGFLRALMAGYWNMGFRKMIFLNGHGQEYIIPSAIHEFGKRYRVPALVIALNWYHAVPEHFGTGDDGPYETPFIHADEAETSWTLALFPELIKQEWVVDNEPYRYLPEGHIDTAGNVGQKPINWYGHIGGGPIEIKAYPEGVVGKPSLASADKAEPGVRAFLDYLEKLVRDINTTFPPGVLPPTNELTERSEQELAEVLVGPRKGGKSIYSLGWPA